MRAELSAYILFSCLAALSACSLTQPSAPGEPGPPPATKKLARADDLSFLRVQSAAARQGRIIYIGVYGGQVPTWEGARYFIPKDWPPYQKLNGKEDLARVAYHDSLMHVLALEIARRFPDSVTVMIKGDTEVVSEVARYLYAPGDKLYLVGHSQGGAVVAEAAVALRDAGIPIQMIAEMEGFLAYRIVPRNVRQAFNFYVPTTFAICPGRDKLEAEDSAATHIENIAVPDPWGPFNGPCAQHRNIDSDPRVWKPVLQYIFESAGRSPDSPLQPASAGSSAQ